MKNFSSYINYLNEGIVDIGSGTRLQTFINSINEHGYGGIEYLYSVPGLVGGAIYMNAGRGRGYNQCIGDYLISVRALIDGVIKVFSKEECLFSHRSSVFQANNAIILSAKFQFPNVSIEETSRLKRERLQLTKTKQDNRYPNAGTAFCTANSKIMWLVMKTSSSQKKENVIFQIFVRIGFKIEETEPLQQQ